MECNKDEAARAIKLAEEKMKDGDFDGAHKFVTKAQRLFPDLDNIQHLIAICDVHSSANKKLCGLDNWYAILQVQQSADADTIKKQYRKLALLLHPDKNKFAGAEAAFKLVGEANRFLSDRIKRSQYDVRYRSHLMLANRQSARNTGRHSEAANKAVENIANVYMFWTCCKHCGHRSKYLREYMDTAMRCSLCKRIYIASNTVGDGVQPSSSTAVKTEPVWQNGCTGAESESSAAEMDKNGTVKGNLNKKNQEDQKNGTGYMKPEKEEGCTEGKAEGGKPQGETCPNNPAKIPKADVLKPQPEVTEPEPGAAKSIPVSKKKQASKRRKKAVEESTCSFEVDGSDVAGAKTVTNDHNKRKSSRKKPEVPYAERGGDSDFVSPPPKKTKSGCKIESDSNTKQKAEDKESPERADFDVTLASLHAYKGKAKKSENSRNKDKESEGCDGNEKDAPFSSKIEIVENGYKANGNPNMLDIPDPEFTVFGDERKTENFAVGQLWSTSDSRDGMPRRYVLVKKILIAEFKLRVTFFEPVRKRNDESIPVACGIFKTGETKEVEDLSIFSGQMLRVSHNRNVIIYPRKGEIWALFRDWNEEWNTSLEKHKLPYKYDFVEVVNDFHDKYGIGVAYLGKIKGFVSLFHHEAQNKVCQIQFPVAEMLRFSHKVPAVKMTGKEKERVPADSFELDPKALPKYIFQNDPVDMGMNSETLKGKANGPYPEAPKAEMNAEPVPEITPSSRKRRKSDDDDLCSNHDKVCSRSALVGEDKGGTSRSNNFVSPLVNGKNTPNKSRKSGENADAFKLRTSPRLQTTTSQQREEKKITKHGDKMNTPKKTDKGLMTDSVGIRKSPNGIQQQAESRVGESSKKRGLNGELPSLSRQDDLQIQLDGSTNKSTKITPGSSSCKTPRRNAYDFKSEVKIRVHQIWAIYGNVKYIPSEYVKIKEIENEPELMLHVAHMKLHPPSTEPVTRPVSCGRFKMETGNLKILPPECFSHQVKPVYNKNNIINVYPRKGEIWAVYKNSDSNEQEHDIVEVVEDYCAERKITKMVVLTAAKGFSSCLYIIQRKQGSSSGDLMEIPEAEMSRFSHRIPAHRHEKRATRLGDGGYWELDPRAIPGRTIVID